MKDVMKFRLVVSALLLMMGPLSYGQAVPTGGTAMTSAAEDRIVHLSMESSITL